MKKTQIISLLVTAIITVVICYIFLRNDDSNKRLRSPFYNPSTETDPNLLIPHVIGGYEIPNSDFRDKFTEATNPSPWFVTIVASVHVWMYPSFQFMIAEQSQSCGGAALNPKIVVTAAHCVVSPKQDRSQFYSGLSNLMDFSNKPEAQVEFNYAHKISIFYNNFMNAGAEIYNYDLNSIESEKQIPGHETDLFIVHPDYESINNKQGDIALIRLADFDYFDHRVSRFAQLPQIPSNVNEINEIFSSGDKSTPGIFDYEDYEVFRLQGYGLVERDHIDHTTFDDYIEIAASMKQANRTYNSSDVDYRWSMEVPAYDEIQPLMNPSQMNYFDLKKITGEQCKDYYLRLNYQRAFGEYLNSDNFTDITFPDFYYDLAENEKDGLAYYYNLTRKDFEWSSMEPGYDKYFLNDPTHFCGTSAKSNSGQAVCSGDSGSPVIVLNTVKRAYNHTHHEDMSITDTIIGVVSSGFESHCMATTDNLNIANVYTDVVYYTPWIQAFTHDNLDDTITARWAYNSSDWRLHRDSNDIYRTYERRVMIVSLVIIFLFIILGCLYLILGLLNTNKTLEKVNSSV